MESLGLFVPPASFQQGFFFSTEATTLAAGWLTKQKRYSAGSVSLRLVWRTQTYPATLSFIIKLAIVRSLVSFPFV